MPKDDQWFMTLIRSSMTAKLLSLLYTLYKILLLMCEIDIYVRCNEKASAQKECMDSI